MGHVTPPQQHIRLLEHRFTESMLGLVQLCGRDLQARCFAKKRRDGFMHAIGVNFGNLRILFFVAVLASDKDIDGGIYHNAIFNFSKSVGFRSIK
jgi:hypothetical protein